MNVLVVDDYPNAAEITCTLVRIMGHDCQAALTGTSALAVAATYEPHVVLLDLGLPDVDGYEVARRLRAECRRRPYIAALTGWGQPTDRARSLAAGIDKHLLKPAGADTLAEVFRAAASVALP
jgi:CheY-like chemotaxis protein